MYIQKILFGSPGTGKSYRVKNKILPDLDIKSPADYIRTVFHPEYTYGDFMGKLMPQTDEAGKVKYEYIPGHFLRAVVRAYQHIILYLHDNKGSSKDKIKFENVKNVALVIDEINRGNSSAIFGTAFQLLDRDRVGWSEYNINLSKLEYENFQKELGMTIQKKNIEKRRGTSTASTFFTFSVSDDKLIELDYDIIDELGIGPESRSLIIPPNLSIIGTMNTSDNSIYFMDSAFKRRWSWEFVHWEEDAPVKKIKKEKLTRAEWKIFVRNINTFILSNHKHIRGIEDKQIGLHFISGDSDISADDIKNKVLFFSLG